MVRVIITKGTNNKREEEVRGGMSVSALESKRLDMVLKGGDEDVEVVGTGTDAVAYALMLADVDVTSAYPIRPYGGVMQTVARLIADGYMKLST